MNGLDSPKALCIAAKQQGYHTLAITDRNGLYGMVQFLQSAREVGIHAIVGSEVWIAPWRMVILLSGLKGYRALCELLSDLHAQRLDAELLLENWHPALVDLAEDGVVLSDQRILLAALRTLFPQNRLYYELSEGLFTHADVRWAREHQIQCVATSRVRHIHPQDAFYYRLLGAIAENTTLSQVNPRFFHPEHCWLWPPERFNRGFSHLPEALANSERIAELCQHDWFEHGVIFPAFAGQNEAESIQALREKCREGLQWRWGAESAAFQRKAGQRLRHELSIIEPKGFASYFLVVEDIVRQSRITCGRGSAAASAVSYCLGITHVDPIKHNLFFERFLNPARVDPPDIDVDFPWDERDQILDYVFGRYPERVAMVSNHITFGARSAVREIAKVYGMPEAEISYVIKRIPEFASSHALSAYRVPARLPQVWHEILTHAQRFDGQLRHLSVHCGGVVITPDPIRRYVPIEMAPKGVPIIQWEKDQAEDAGLVKIDLLGNRSLAVIRDTLAAVRASGQEAPRYWDLNPVHDPQTQQALGRGDTLGVFYIESPATRLLLQKMRTGEFEHIVVASSIIRPAANKYANEFVRRMHGKPYQPLHPLLADILAETHGIMVYQEDVSKTSMALAGFQAAEGEGLRKVLTKKHKQKQLEDYRRQFYQGAAKNGAAKATIDAIWQMILSFAGYSFCKPHSASYALVSFKACYLRQHHPAEFMAAVISNQGGYYSTMTYLDEARRMGLTILPPDVNESQTHYTGSQGQLRVGLMQVKHLSQTCTGHILAERSKAAFSSFEDFLLRVQPQVSDAKVLIKSRCFQSLQGESSLSALMWRLYYYQAAAQNGVSSLMSQPLPPVIGEYSAAQLIEWELEYLQGPVRLPPWGLYEHALRRPGRIKGCDLPRMIGRHVVLFGLKITSKTTITKKREEMRFVTFSDDTALIETVFFPDALEHNRDLLLLGGAYMIHGKVESELGAIQVQVRHLEKVLTCFAENPTQVSLAAS